MLIQIVIYIGTSEGHIYSLTRLANNSGLQGLHRDPFPRHRYIWDVYTLPHDYSKIIVPVSGFGTAPRVQWRHPEGRYSKMDSD